MASSHLGSVEAISPTKPRSCSVFFLRARKTWRVAAGEADGGDAALGERGDERFVDAAAEDHEGGVAGFGVGDAEAGDELGLLAQLGEEPGELHAAAVDERDLVAVAGEVGDGLRAGGEERGVFKGGSAEFDDEFHGWTPEDRCEKQIPCGNDRKKGKGKGKLSSFARQPTSCGYAHETGHPGSWRHERGS